jgi:serine/threonine-protein kinase
VSLEIGSTIGTYRLTELIGQGGMGLVFVAEHTLIGKRAAVKVVRPELVAQDGVASRFINEARAVNTVGDEHIVDIFDAGQTPEGVVYCVMELLTGESLQDFHRRAGRVDLDTVLDITLQIARALHACHQKRIVHRDLKPANIFIVQRGGGPFVKILDFGVAKLIGQNGNATHSNAILGTPFYMAPEQCRGSRDLDHRLDVYALGVILYELCTGDLPFEGNSVADIMIKQATEPPIDPRARAPELPEWLSRVILMAMAKNRDARFPDMAAFAAALEEHLPDREASGVPSRHSQVPRRDSRSSKSPSGGHAVPEPRTPGHGATLEPAVTPALAGVRSGGSNPASGTAPARRRSSSRAVAAVALLVGAGVLVASRYAMTSSDVAASADPPSLAGSEEPKAAAASAVPGAAAAYGLPPATAVIPKEPETVPATASDLDPPVPVVRPVSPEVTKPAALKPPPAPVARPAEARAAAPAASAITVTPAASSSSRPLPPRPRANLESFFPP